jgi:hypothetical protein
VKCHAPARAGRAGRSETVYYGPRPPGIVPRPTEGLFHWARSDSPWKLAVAR